MTIAKWGCIWYYIDSPRGQKQKQEEQNYENSNHAKRGDSMGR